MSTDKLIQSFQTTHWIIKAQTAGLSHEDSVRQLPFRSNCLNWVLGHIMNSRDRVLTVLGEAPALTPEEHDRYERGSDPVEAGDGGVRLERLLEALEDSQTRIETALAAATPEALATIVDEKNQRTLHDRVSGLHWHETYHTGQLEILRQAAGTNDRIIG